MSDYAIETRDLAKSYGSRVHALKGVDLKVPKGTVFGLLGPNGAGKSTLVKTLLGIVTPSRGAATIMGKDIADPESRRNVGYLPEGHRFPRYLTGRGVCEYFGKLGGLYGKELQKEIDEKLELVGMSQWGNTRIVRYSKGMNQRVGLAQAMLGKPNVIFLDEPTDGVDPVGRTQIRDVIRAITKQGTTVFLNSHLLLEVEEIADHVAIMHHGEVLRQGTVDEIREAVGKKPGKIIVRFVTHGSLGDDGNAAFKERFGKRVKPDDRGGGWDVTLDSKEQVTDVIDFLRAREVKIFSIEEQKANLEEAFIDLISAQDDQSVGATS